MVLVQYCRPHNTLKSDIFQTQIMYPMLFFILFLGCRSLIIGNVNNTKYYHYLISSSDAGRTVTLTWLAQRHLRGIYVLRQRVVLYDFISRKVYINWWKSGQCALQGFIWSTESWRWKFQYCFQNLWHPLSFSSPVESVPHLKMKLGSSFAGVLLCYKQNIPGQTLCALMRFYLILRVPSGLKSLRKMKSHKKPREWQECRCTFSPMF